MKKKTEGFQVRVGGELAAEIEQMRSAFSARTSRPAYVEMLIRAGIAALKTVDKLNELDAKQAK